MVPTIKKKGLKLVEILLRASNSENGITRKKQESKVG